jgi:hypothetical protein
LDNERYIYLVFEGKKKEITTKVLGDDRTFLVKKTENVLDEKERTNRSYIDKKKKRRRSRIKLRKPKTLRVDVDIRRPK